MSNTIKALMKWAKENSRIIRTINDLDYNCIDPNELLKKLTELAEQESKSVIHRAKALMHEGLLVSHIKENGKIYTSKDVSDILLIEQEDGDDFLKSVACLTSEEYTPPNVPPSKNARWSRLR